ncbi:BglG family transcription antiterminator [Robertmurraya korlensis]|uniref:BglG family transcription antiterminator n=1 Tax=Robertmurraya korlensis TaxID=519977 RepID=UPI001E5A73B8|nr:BglG family transcription antiterminator [Robertmurraya korlensis]
MIEKRPALLMKHLLQVKKTTLKQVIDKTNLTRRQVSYDLEKINHWLKKRELPSIPYKGTKYIAIPETVVEYFYNHRLDVSDQDFIFSENERLSFIYLYLFIREEPISSVHLTQLLQVSKNTVISDVKKANGANAPFLVEIRYSRQVGYHLYGTELDKRVLVQHHLSRLTDLPYFHKLIFLLLGNKEQIHINFIKGTLNEIQKQFHLQFVEDRLNQFAYFLVLYFYRLKEMKFVRYHQDEIELLKKDSLWDVAQSLFKYLQIEELETEVCFMTIQFLGLSLGNQQSLESDRDLLFKLCDQLVYDFESKTAIVFEKKNEAIQTLYQHLKPAYFRMKYRIPITNPLLEQIKSEHKELYSIVSELLLPIESLLSITIPEEEIGFITIHFGALLQSPKKTIPKKKRAIVVCPSGISSSLMVKHLLESLFSEISVEKTLSLQDFYAENTEQYDLLFSTVEIDSKIPCFYVKPIMTPNEKNNLVNEVYQCLLGIQYKDISIKELFQTIGQYANVYDETGLKKALSQLTFHKRVEVKREEKPVLSDLLKEETIQIMDQLSSWEEAVTVAAKPLVMNGVIETTYIDSMIDNIKTLGPYVVIGPEVAIPHARPDSGVNKVGMSFLKLKTPVYFLDNEDYPVRLLFCIAAIDNTTHLKALSQLTKLLSNSKNIDLLKEVDSMESILEMFKQYSIIS